MANRERKGEKSIKSGFSELIQGETPVLVDFYADWCGPCKMMAPILKDLKKRLGDRVQIIKVDTEKNPAAAIRYQVRGVPTLILFREGAIIWQHSGVLPLHELEAIIDRKLRAA